MLKYRSSLQLSFAVLLFALLTCAAAAAQRQPRPAQRLAGGTHRSVSAESVTEDLSDGASFTFKIAPDLPEFIFKVIPEPREPDQYGNAQSTVRDIEVFRGDSKQPVQHLTSCDLSGMEPPRKGSDWFRADDINFDGYVDCGVAPAMALRVLRRFLRKKVCLNVVERRIESNRSLPIGVRCSGKKIYEGFVVAGLQ